MSKKKCLNCLCMVDINAKVCSFCKTPFKEGRIHNVPINKFSPPVLGVNNKEFEINNIQLENQNNENENNENSESEKHESKFKEIISFILNRRNTESPYFIPPFEIESLEIADIKDYDEEEKRTFQNPDSISVDAESLEEINQLANLFIDENELKKEENNEIKKPEKDLSSDRFISKDILRSEIKEIEDKKNEDEPILNIKNLIISLEDITAPFENKKEEVFDIQSLDLKENKTEESKKEEVFDIQSLDLKENKTEENKKEEVFDIQSLDLKENKTEEKSNIKSEKEKTYISQPKGSENDLAIKYYDLARDLCVRKDYKNALIELEKSVNLDPKFEQAHILLSRTYIKLKKDGLIDVKD